MMDIILILCPTILLILCFCMIIHFLYTENVILKNKLIEKKSFEDWGVKYISNHFIPCEHYKNYKELQKSFDEFKNSMVKIYIEEYKKEFSKHSWFRLL